MPEETPVNTGVPWPTSEEAWHRVLGIQTKLHRWAGSDPSARFNDLFNLVVDPAFLQTAWDRVCSNAGARTAGVDGWSAHRVVAYYGVEGFLQKLREMVKAGQFRPRPVRERLIPKPGSTKKRRLGIPTIIDRVVQAALKLVLEPIFEADFHPYSYGFRPGRRAQDAIAEIHTFTSRGYEWVLEADIEACFDSIDHTALMGRVRRRVGDKRVLTLVKGFLKSGILTETGRNTETITGTPQGGILSPLLANIALSALDDWAHQVRQGAMDTASRRCQRRLKGLANWRLVRYADDFVILVIGTREHAEQLRDEVAAVLAPMGLRLSATKTSVVGIDEGFDFLGFRIQRHRQRGGDKRYVYTYPSKKALTAIKDKVRKLTGRNTSQDLASLLRTINPRLRGWCNYFQHGASKRTFSYLDHFAWKRVAIWVRRRHPKLSWRHIRRRFLIGWEFADSGVVKFNPAKVTVSRYRYRGNKITNPWTRSCAA